MVSTRLNPMPLINGFEILGPVLSTLNPGVLFDNASITLFSLARSIILGLMVLTDMGFSFIKVAFETAVTATSSNICSVGFKKISNSFWGFSILIVSV